MRHRPNRAGPTKPFSGAHEAGLKPTPVMVGPDQTTRFGHVGNDHWLVLSPRLQDSVVRHSKAESYLGLRARRGVFSTTTLGCFEPSVHRDDLCSGQWCPEVVALVWESRMSTLQRRLSVVNDTITNLNAQIYELNRLRDQVRKAQLSARTARRKSRRKRTRI